MRWHSVTVVPSLTPRLEPLNRLARNLWYTWNPETVELWRRLDRDLWEEVYHNPVRLLGRLSQERLAEASVNESFLLNMDRVVEAFDQYMGVKTPYNYHLEKNLDPTFRVAYFSMEYGLTEALPIYSGGLGILSGDHLKSASNLNLPLIGVGLLYREGYFGQYLNKEGWQQENYTINDYENMPIVQEKDAEGRPIEISIEMGDHDVRVNIWRVQVGRIPLFLLNSNLPENSSDDREITAQLYGGDRDMRIRQEIVLGMGGIRALEVLGIKPTSFHMNEGHSAFAGLERVRKLVKDEGFSLEAAKEVVKSNTVFTTHTPVPAGNDYFTQELVEKYFMRYAEDLGVPFHDVLSLGKQNPDDGQEIFCMTVLAIRLSNYRNGVSRLHMHVSRRMWHGIWWDIPVKDVPIHYVTNGVHIPSYISFEMADLFDRYLGPRWFEDPDNEKVWERVDRIPSAELWRTHERRRERLIAFARRRLKEQLVRRSALPSEVKEAEDVLNPEALTICFARRFATYKRGDILFRDPERLSRILNDADRPVQILFAGKAHPQDAQGKEIIKNIVHYELKEEFRDHVIFLENYDINVARYLVQGADVWLNTPRRPLEACGTSGMKAVANGALHMSVLDGWWDEGYAPERGWAIGAGEQYLDTDYQDEIEGRALYELLEREVIPLFYERSRDGTPRGWVEKMKSSMRHLCPTFNTHRMLEDYTDMFYIPASGIYQEMKKDKKKNAEDFANWKRTVRERWKDLSIQGMEFEDGDDEIPVGSPFEMKARIRLGALQPEDIRVDLYYGPIDTKNEMANAATEPMVYEAVEGDGCYVFKGVVRFKETGKQGFAVRILPKHPMLVNSIDMGLVVWG